MMSNKRFVFFIFFCLLTLNVFAATDTDEYSSFMDKGFVAKADVDCSFRAWIPNQSYLLEYDTKGLPLVKMDAEIAFKRLFPTVHVSWETTFFDMKGIANPRGLLVEHQKSDGLRAGYNKIKGIVGLGRIFGNNYQHEYYNPWRPNSNVSLYYNRETFRIGVSPRVSGLRYCDFDGEITKLDESEAVYQYTKFEEMSVDINSNGKMILPAIFSLLFLDFNDRLDFGLTFLDTTIGPYYSTWQKPYSVTQIFSEGVTSGNERDIYSAKFYSFGAVEKWCYAGEYFYFNNKINWGLAFVQLSRTQILFDSSSVVFMQFNIEPEVGFHLPMVNHHVVLSCYAGGNWGFMSGVVLSKQEDEILDFSSFVNSDIIIKASMAVTVLL